MLEKPGNKYVAIWQKISFESGPYPRTSHTCVSYKNRYLVVIGGETETVNITGKISNEESNESDDEHSKQEEVSAVPLGKAKGKQSSCSENSSEEPEKEPLSDVWIFDTFLRKWK